MWVEELGSASGPWSRQGFHVQCRWEEKASLPGAFGLRRYLVAPCSLIGQKCPGQACDPTAVEGLCPNTTCLPTHRLPRVLPAVHLGPGALLHPVSGKQSLELIESRKDRKEELGSQLGEGQANWNLQALTFVEKSVAFPEWEEQD